MPSGADSEFSKKRVRSHGYGLSPMPGNLRAAAAVPDVRRALAVPGLFAACGLRARIGERLAANSLGANARRPGVGAGTCLWAAPVYHGGPSGGRRHRPNHLEHTLGSGNFPQPTRLELARR